MSYQVRLFLVALQFYTRLPVRGRLAAWMGWDEAWLAPATRWFPLVGVLVGLLCALAYALTGAFLPHGVAVVVAMACGLLLTGAFHEDGFADFCDGFGGHNDAPRTLEIMKDSRIGAYGAIGLVMLLLGRFETLASMDPGWVASALVAGAAFSRGCAVGVMGSLPYAREDALSKVKPVARQVAGLDLTIALCVAVAVPLWLMAWTGSRPPMLLAMAFAATVTLWLRVMMRRRLGGYTGDCLGAVQQAAELAFHVGLLGGLLLGNEMGPVDPGA